MSGPEALIAKVMEMRRSLPASTSSSGVTMDMYDHGDNWQFHELERRLTERINALERHLSQKLEHIMAAQDDVNAVAARIETVATDIQAKVDLIGTDVAAIKAALDALPANVDTTALDSAITDLEGHAADLDTAVDSVSGLVPPPASN
jgi:outer membrane murein-binding lipoprotein Lpp